MMDQTNAMISLFRRTSNRTDDAMGGVKKKWKPHRKAIITSYDTGKARVIQEIEDAHETNVRCRRAADKTNKPFHVDDGVDGEARESTEGESEVPALATPPLNIAFIVNSFLRCRTRSASSAPPVIFSFLPPTKVASSECSSSVRFANSCCLIF